MGSQDMRAQRSPPLCPLRLMAVQSAQMHSRVQRGPDYSAEPLNPTEQNA